MTLAHIIPLSRGPLCQILAQLALVSFVIAGGMGYVRAQDAQPLSVPAEFIRNIQLPGQGDQIKRPTALHFDRHHGEIFVGDQGNNRIIIFAASGAFKFEFPLRGVMTTPRDIVTDQEGYIFILGSSPDGRVLFKFDYDGLPLEAIPLPEEDGEIEADFRSLDLDASGRLFLLDHSTGRVYKNQGGEYSSFLLKTSFTDETDTLKTVFGDLRIRRGEVLVPVASLGTVVRHSPEGEYLGKVGVFGSLPGNLNFPTCVEVTDEGLMLVLDTGRFCVVGYDEEGSFLGEFGGKGQSPGWFINPSLLACAGNEKVIVGQIFRNKIQICRIPTFISEKIVERTPVPEGRSALSPGQVHGPNPRRFFVQSTLDHCSQRRTIARLYPQLVSHLEVSE